MLQSREHIGELDRKILIQEKEITTNSVNEEVITWVNITNPTPWAAVREGKGREQLRADQVDVVQQTIFKIRHRSDLNERMRIVYNERPYYIEGFVEIGRKRYLDIYTMLDNEEEIT